MNRSCKEIKRIARSRLNGNYRIVMRALLLVLLITIAIDLPFSSLLRTEHPTTLQNILYYIVEFLIGIISGVLQIGLIQMHLSLARGQAFDSQQVFFCFRNQTDRYILCVVIKMICTAICGVPIALALTYITYVAALSTKILLVSSCSLLSICLVAYVNLTLYPMSYLLLDHREYSVRNAFSEAKKLMSGNRKRLLYLFLSFIGMDILEILSFGIGSLWIEPYKSQTYANFYLEIIGDLERKPSISPTYKPFNASV